MSIQILGMTVATELIALVVLAFTAGMCVPFRYGIERLRGFGRAVVSKLPYKPPTNHEDHAHPVEKDRSDSTGSK